MTTPTLTALAAASLLSACAMSGGMSSSAQTGVPDAVRVPAGHSVVLETVGAGDITYECRARKDMAGAFEWAFAGPDARLMDRSGKAVGRYYGPPATWESNDGSRITGTQLAIVPGGEGNIPLQLVKANPAMGMGAMQGVSHVQRLATRGGVAPAMVCTAGNAGQKSVVKYQADYIFWRAAS
ncbi:MAG: DUF3455 domain-containing protein [Hylemonella sp.]|nr:DUF3455 domain-containing protein [Hylemonella sp.]